MEVRLEVDESEQEERDEGEGLAANELCTERSHLDTWQKSLLLRLELLAFVLRIKKVVEGFVQVGAGSWGRPLWSKDGNGLGANQQGDCKVISGKGLFD